MNIREIFTPHLIAQKGIRIGFLCEREETNLLNSIISLRVIGTENLQKGVAATQNFENLDCKEGKLIHKEGNLLQKRGKKNIGPNCQACPIHPCFSTDIRNFKNWILNSEFS